MKDILEKIWLVIQIGAVLGAAYWGLTKWKISDEKMLEPQIIASSTKPSAVWIDQEETTCSISTLWTLENKGSTPVEVLGISYKLLSVPDKKEQLPEGKYMDASLGNLEKNDITTEILLQKSDDTILSNGEINRDIMIRYNPLGEKSKSWFKNNRLTILITAQVRNSTSGWWCPFCESQSQDTEYYSELSWYCNGK